MSERVLPWLRNRFKIVIGLFLLCSVCLLFCRPVFAFETIQDLYDYFLEVFEMTEPSETPLHGFHITAGLPKPIESTFDATRVLVGTAPKDTEIQIILYQYVEPPSEPIINANAEDQEEPIKEYKPFEATESFALVVGSSSLFIKTIELPLGRCFVYVKASHETDGGAVAACVNRKAAEIQKELVESIALPGPNPFVRQ